MNDGQDFASLEQRTTKRARAKAAVWTSHVRAIREGLAKCRAEEEGRRARGEEESECFFVVLEDDATPITNVKGDDSGRTEEESEAKAGTGAEASAGGSDETVDGEDDGKATLDPLAELERLDVDPSRVDLINLSDRVGRTDALDAFCGGGLDAYAVNARAAPRILAMMEPAAVINARVLGAAGEEGLRPSDLNAPGFSPDDIMCFVTKIGRSLRSCCWPKCSNCANTQICNCAVRHYC